MKNRRDNITEPFRWNNNKIFMTVDLDDDKRVIDVSLSAKEKNVMGRLLIDVGELISRLLAYEAIENLATHFPFQTVKDVNGERNMNDETITTIVIRKLNDINEEFKDGK